MNPSLMRINGTLSTHWIEVMLIGVKHRYFPEGHPNGVASFGFNHGGNSVVKRAQAGVVLG